MSCTVSVLISVCYPVSQSWEALTKVVLNVFQAHLPFAVIGSTEELKIGNKMMKARQYPWGTVQGESRRENFMTWMVTFPPGGSGLALVRGAGTCWTLISLGGYPLCPCNSKSLCQDNSSSVLCSEGLLNLLEERPSREYEKRPLFLPVSYL